MGSNKSVIKHAIKKLLKFSFIERRSADANNATTASTYRVLESSEVAAELKAKGYTHYRVVGRGFEPVYDPELLLPQEDKSGEDWRSR